MSLLNGPRFDRLVNNEAPEPDVSEPSVAEIEEGILAAETRKEMVRLQARENAKRLFEIDRHEKAASARPGGVERLLTGGSGILDQPDIPEAVWGDGSKIAWAEGQGTMIAAPQGVGKSTLAQNIIFRRIGIIDEPLLGMPVKRTEAKVLYLAMDRPLQALQSMKRMVSEKDRQVLDELLVVWTGPLPFSILSEPLRLAEWVQEVAPGCRTVVIDSVKDMAAGISGDEPGAAVNTAWQELIANGVEVLALHHQRKAAQGQSMSFTINDIYGSTWLTSGLGSVLMIDGETGSSVVTLKHVKSVIDMLDDTPIRTDMATGMMHEHDPSTMTLAEVLKQAGWQGVTAKEAARKVYGADGTAEVRKMKRELGKMTELLTVTKMERAPGASGNAPDWWRLTNPHAARALDDNGLASLVDNWSGMRADS